MFMCFDCLLFNWQRLYCQHVPCTVDKCSNSSFVLSLLCFLNYDILFGGYVGSSKLLLLLKFQRKMCCAIFFKDSSFCLVKLRSNYCMQDVDAEIALHLKRLGRKDPTTKVIHLPVIQCLSTDQLQTQI